MTLQQLTYLVTVADCGNITEAAEKLLFHSRRLVQQFIILKKRWE